MSTVKTLLKPVVLPILKPITRNAANSGLQELIKLGTPETRKIAMAIEQALEGTLSAEEQQWVSRIERKRRELNESLEPIQQIDYGSGKSGETRTQEEMENGFLVESSIGLISQNLSKPYFWSILLFKLIREFKPQVALELGTALGISAAYQGAAQQLNGQGRTLSLEGNPSFADLATRNLSELGLDNVNIIVGRFADTLNSVSMQEKPLSYVFIDGHHDEMATVAYFEELIPTLADKSLLVFDDISWSAGMRRAWQRIREHTKCAVSVDLGSIGLCIVDDEHEVRAAVAVVLKYV